MVGGSPRPWRREGVGFRVWRSPRPASQCRGLPIGDRLSRNRAMESLICRSLPLCLPTTIASIHRNKWRWRSTASLTSPRVRSTPLQGGTANAHFWTTRTVFLNSSGGTFVSGASRRPAVFDDLDETDAAVLVVGGGGLGMEAVRALIGADLLVAAYQREEKFDVPEMFHDDIEEMGWDVIDVATIEKVLESAPFEAIVCTVGGGITRPDFHKDVPIKLVNAAKMAGVTRLILVSGVGVGDSLKALDEKTMEEVAEEAVKSSELNYTIIRPGELLSAPRTGNGILIQKTGIAGLISRADVAALILEVLFNEKSYGKTLTAIDRNKLLPPTASLDGVELMSL